MNQYRRRSAAFVAILLLLTVVVACVATITDDDHFLALPETGTETTTSSSGLSSASNATATDQQPLASLTPTSTPTAVPANTNIPAPTEALALGETPSPSSTPTSTPSAPTATATPDATATPTSVPQQEPTLSVTGVGQILEGAISLPTAVPSPVPTFESPHQITNILLLGGDKESHGDSTIIVSINHDLETASMLSIPRDLIVYEPNSIVRPINTIRDPEDLKQTILYNFGIPIHYYAQVDFDGFSSIVDAIDGVDMTVTCPVYDIWELKEPGLDPNDIENWNWHTLEPGVYHMDGNLALWYARSRRTTSDYERGLRQQQLLQAILSEGVNLNLVPQVPALWNAYKDVVKTDMDIGKMLQLAALAPGVKENGVQSLFLRGKAAFWEVPADSTYLPHKWTLVPIWEGDNMMEETFERLYLPPVLSKSTGPPVLVEVINASGDPDAAIFAAQNLSTYGFTAVVNDEEIPSTTNEKTELFYYAPNMKGIRYDWLIPWVVGLRRDDLQLVDDEPDYPYTYKVVLGEDYNPCLNPTDPNAPHSLLE